MCEIEKTCENCMYDEEPANGKHCGKCIHNATENFNPKMDYKMVQDIRNKAIDDFVETVKTAVSEMDDIGTYDNPDKWILEILDIEAERLKEGDDNDR